MDPWCNSDRDWLKEYCFFLCIFYLTQMGVVRIVNIMARRSTALEIQVCIFSFLGGKSLSTGVHQDMDKMKMKMKMKMSNNMSKFTYGAQYDIRVNVSSVVYSSIVNPLNLSYMPFGKSNTTPCELTWLPKNPFRIIDAGDIYVGISCTQDDIL